MFRRWLIRLVLIGMLLGAALVVFVPSVRARAETIPLRVAAWWHELQPHELTVPPPRADVVIAFTPQVTPVEPASVPTPVASREPTAPPSAALTASPPTPTAAPVASATPALRVPTPPAEFRLANFRHEYQGWNNCGPVTVGMVLSHYGFSDTQKEIAPVLKPNQNDRNVGPDELAAYVRSKPGFEALVLVNASLPVLKQLIANDLPVIVETWFTPKPNDGMGHYRLLFAYSDPQQQFSALDSYNGPNVKLPYSEFEADWKVFNRLALVAYRREQAPLVRAITGFATSEAMWRGSEAKARAETAQNGDDAYAWFNLGASLSAQGRHGEAAAAFDRARRIGLPWRMLWYQFGIFDSYLAVGRTQDVLDLTAANLRQTTDLEETYYYQGRALAALGRKSEAQQAYRDALKLNPNYLPATKALAQAS